MSPWESAGGSRDTLLGLRSIPCHARRCSVKGGLNQQSLYYPGSIHRTDKEATLWTQFWSDHGLSQTEVAYARGLSQGSDLSHVETALTHPKVRVIGLVVDAVDKLMHGMTLGTAGMHNQVRQWTAEGFLARLLDLLFDHSYAVFLTSDHGNIECM